VTILDFARPETTSSAASAAPLPRAGVRLVELNDGLWRVTRPDGDVLGYVEKLLEAAGTRYRAKRMIVSQQRFVSVGEFWSADDAVACFRVG